MNRLRIAISVSLCVLFALPVLAQKPSPHPILRSFTALRQPEGVNLTWVIKGGQQCFGIRIFRSDETLLFDEIDHIDGVCGDTEADEAYEYFDADPISNTHNHYRLEMGSQGFTDTVQVFYEDFGADRYLLVSENVSNQFRVLFSNDNNREAFLEVFDVSGNLMFEDSRAANNFRIAPDGWRAGVYVFRISGVSETDITGKLYFSPQ